MKTLKPFHLTNRLHAEWRRTARWGRNLAAAVAAVATLSHTPAVKAFEGDWAGTSGRFSFVTYNIAGLPYFINSPGTLIPGWQLLGKLPFAPGFLRPSNQDPVITTPEIGRRINRFDVVNVQEDFNFHAYLYDAATSFSYRTPTQGGIPFGSGLNTLSKMTVNGLQRIKWRNCRTDSCPIPKGFTFQRLQVGRGSYVDMYNIHTHAHDSPDDLWVRRDNMIQLAEFIGWWSAGNAVIVAGDTNARWTREGDNLREFTAMTGLTDTWVQAQRGGSPPPVGWAIDCPKGQETNACEVVDKILYRSGRDVTLWMEGYSNEDRNYLDARGVPLSDHRPIAAWFGWRETAPKFALIAQNASKCVNVADESNAPGAQVIQWDCRNGTQNGHELFRQVDDTLRFTHTGMCMDVKDASMLAGAPVVQWPCTGALNQRIRYEGNRAVFKHSNMCLNVEYGSKANGARLVQWPCQGAPNEVFYWRF